MSYIWRPTETDSAKSLAVSHLKQVLAIDNSGSTAGTILGIEKAVANNIIARTANKSVHGVIAWNSTSKLEFVDNIRSMACTQPQSMFDDSIDGRKCTEKIVESDVMVLFTDGAICEPDVNKFSVEMITKANHLSLVIGILVAHRTPIPGQSNISVFLPAMIGNGIIVQVDMNDINDANKLYLLHAQGEVAKQLPLISIGPDTQWKDVPSINIAMLQSIIVSIHPRAPAGFVRSGDVFINVDSMMQDKTITFESLQLINMEQITQITRSQNKINEFRSWLQDIERNICSVANMNAACDLADPDTVRCASQLRGAIAANESNEVIANLRAKFIELRDIANIRTAANQKLIREQVAPIKRYFQNIYGDLNELQKGSYSLDSLNLKSNRAKRAEIIQDIVDTNTLSLVNYTGAFESECEICTETAPVCLMVREFASDDAINNTNDYVLNFPLACGKSNACVIPSQITCIKCAQYLWATGHDAVRVGITHAIPIVDLCINTNRTYIYAMLSNALASGKALGHLWMLYYALMDQVECIGWVNDEWRSLSIYVRNQIANNLKTRDTLSEEGDMVLIKDAFVRLCTYQGERDIMRQPLESVLLILRNSAANKSRAVFLARSSLVKLIVTRYLKSVLDKTTDVLLDAMDCDIFETRHKIPQQGSTRVVKWYDSKFINGLFSAAHLCNVKQDIQRFADVMEVPMDSVMSDKACLVLLWALRGITIHRKTEDTIAELIQTDKAFMLLMDYNSYMADSQSLVLETIIDRINSEVFSHRDTAPGHEMSPPFITPYGPSVCKCICGMDFRTDVSGTLDQIIANIKTNRSAHFIEIYGSEVPNRSSYHVPLHKFARSVIIGNESHRNLISSIEDIVSDVMKALRETRGNRGHIYYNELELHTRRTVDSYFDICSRMPDTLESFIPVTERYELEVYGKVVTPRTHVVINKS
jgi:hypothetical protein